MLRLARALGDELVVVLANDAHNTKPTAVPASRRAAAMKALGLADRIVIGRPESFVETLRRERPQIIALGFDQDLPDEATRSEAERLGVAVMRLPWCPGRGEAIAP